MTSFVTFVITAAVTLFSTNLTPPLTFVHGYTHNHCTRATASDFSFDDCYIPPQNPDLLLTSASFVFSHNAATGYIVPNSLSKAGLSWWYSKNQIGNVYKQLDDGARALDLRLIFKTQTLSNGTEVSTIGFHHGSVHITSVTFEELLKDAIRWCKDNPSELVLLLHSHFDYYDSSSYYSSKGLVSALKAIYQKYGVSYRRCSKMYGRTIDKVMGLSQLNEGDGYLLALDGKDGSTSCTKENWISSQLVTCYPSDLNNATCKSSTVPLERLKTYISGSVHNSATDNRKTNGPPYDLYTTPFNEVQGLWQVDTHAVAVGMRHASSIIQDNRASKLNSRLVEFIYSGALEDGVGSPSLVALDNVALHGNAVLSVLRNMCGQSSEEVCGRDVPMPRMTWLHVSAKQFVILLVVTWVGFVVWLTAWIRKQQQIHGKKWTLHKYTSRIWNTAVVRCQEDVMEGIGMETTTGSRREQLL